jgi:N-carbamoyl-L-amino-acid hydrolase
MSTNEQVAALRVDGQRLWSRLMDMARVGATANGGSNRQALTDEDRAGRELFFGWCERAGYELRVDQIGNMFARRPGSDPNAPVVMTGSHLDTQPTGGRFDGPFGVLAALEALETLDDHGVRTKHPLEVVNWTNEEGCRFDHGMMGSAVFAGAATLEEAYALTDRSGASVRQELERIAMLGPVPAEAGSIKAVFEAHIEQSTRLGREKKTIGVVTGVQHMSRHRILVFGREAHAGTTPMTQRKDPVMGLAGFLPRLYAMAEEQGPDGRLTFGFLDARPGSMNTVPGRLEVTVDIRHPSKQGYDAMVTGLDAIVRKSCDEIDLRAEVDCFWTSPGVDFAEPCLASLRSAVATLGYPSMEMVSGAGHDACLLAPIAPTAMLFVPSRDGISHNEAEYTAPDEVEAGANVLLHALLDQAL